MQKVTVKRSELLKKVKANRDAHRDLFEKAQIGYRAAVIKELDQMLKDASANRQIRRSINLPEPIDHTKDYDRVITMLEMSTSSAIELEAHEFDMYVMDNWAWREMAFMTNSTYAPRN